jgi:hypothetical protein
MQLSCHSTLFSMSLLMKHRGNVFEEDSVIFRQHMSSNCAKFTALSRHWHSFTLDKPLSHIARIRVGFRRACIRSFIHSFIHSSMDLQPFGGPWPLPQFLNLFFLHRRRTPWTSDQPVTRPLPTHRVTPTQNKRIHKHPYFQWDWNPRSQLSSERRQLMP